MNNYVLVKIDKDELIDMLCERVEFWTDCDDTIALFREYYSSMVCGDCFEGIELNIMGIVDNDYVNWLKWGTIEELTDEGYEVNECDILAKYDDLIMINA